MGNPYLKTIKLNKMPLQPWKVPEYTALITQTGTAAPTTTELLNTLGELTMTRIDTGQYLLTFDNELPELKTTFSIENNNTTANTKFTIKWNSTTSLMLYTVSGVFGTDELLNKTPIKIQVYNI